MRRILGRALVGMGIAASLCLPMTTPAAFAQSASIDAWATIDATHPAPGCTVGVTVELRDGGSPLTAADVSILLSDDGTGEVVSSDRSVTGDSGVAYLSYDAPSSAKNWLEIDVNGQYLGGVTIWADGSSCDQGSSVVDFSGDVPAIATSGGDDVSSAEASSDGGAVILPNVSAYQQQRPLSCEYASLAIATGALGNWISEYDFDDLVGWSDNPHWGYRGDIWGVWGNTTDYGVYAEALVPALNAYGFNANVFYGGTDNLTAAIDAGQPTVVWLGLWGDQSVYPATSDGTSYQVTAGMHVMVVYGYDDGGVYVSDPGLGTLHYYDWSTFLYYWDVMDQMALAVSN
ncbi:MAG TPA: C39 family peptidase [Thermomicrobiales bacterium]|nr:C39 family peptidase [Thermomicrobiales bacterium]